MKPEQKQSETGRAGVAVQPLVSKDCVVPCVTVDYFSSDAEQRWINERWLYEVRIHPNGHLVYVQDGEPETLSDLCLPPKDIALLRELDGGSGVWDRVFSVEAQYCLPKLIFSELAPKDHSPSSGESSQMMSLLPESQIPRTFRLTPQMKKNAASRGFFFANAKIHSTSRRGRRSKTGEHNE